MYKYSINDKTYDILFDPEYTALNENSRVLTRLEYFSYGDRCEEVDEIKQINDKVYNYSDENHNFYFSLVSDQYKDEEKKNFLLSSDRYGKCHKFTLSMLLSSPKVTAITGYVTFNDKKYIHSIIEIDELGAIWDFTRNIILKKDDYYKLTCFEEIQKVSHEDAVVDAGKILGLDMSDKCYLTFRDEIIDNIDKKIYCLKN